MGFLVVTLAVFGDLGINNVHFTPVPCCTLGFRVGCGVRGCGYS